MKRYLFRFGIPTILTVMFAGILFILNSFELRTKTNANLVLSDDGKIKVYVGHTESRAPRSGDTVVIDRTMAGSLTVVTDSVREEPGASVLYVRLPGGDSRELREKLGENTFATGYVYVDRVKMRTLLFKRIGR